MSHKSHSTRRFYVDLGNDLWFSCEFLRNVAGLLYTSILFFTRAFSTKPTDMHGYSRLFPVFFEKYRVISIYYPGFLIFVLMYFPQNPLIVWVFLNIPYVFLEMSRD